VVGTEWGAITDGAAAGASVNRDRVIDDDDELQESRVVKFVNDVLQWSSTEETAIYALHGYQIEEIEELRRSYYRRRYDLGEGAIGGRRRQQLQPLRKKPPPLQYDEDMLDLPRRERKGAASRRGYLS
jgi:hypothetical protein